MARYAGVIPLRHLLASMEPAERNDLTKAIGTSYEYLYHLGRGHRRASVKMARRLAEVCNGDPYPKITLGDIRPDLLDWR